MRRVVVTGLGMVSPVGNSCQESWESALAGKSGIARITRFDPSDFGAQIAGEVKNFDATHLIPPKDCKRMNDHMLFALVAAEEALKDSGLDSSQGHNDIGCSIGVGIGGLQSMEDTSVALNKSGPRKVSPFFVPYMIANMAAGVVSNQFGLRGPNICTCTACTSGTHGIGEAFLYIKSGMANGMVCGGSEAAISPVAVAGFGNMKALATKYNETPEQASRPFDRDRDGFVIAEGAGILVLEELEFAKKRGAKIYAEVVGYGMSGDGHHVTAPAPDGEGAVRCMRQALQSAGVAPEDVQYINAHGTSTALNDKYETAAIKTVFGAHASSLKVSSTKSVTGHCLGAAGGIEAIFLAKALHHGIVPPTANLQNPDEGLDLDYVPHKAQEVPGLKVGISNSFGFGGTNGCLVMAKF